jgi:hypothetical protein
MPSPIFFPADFQLLIERARLCTDDLAVAGKPTQLLSFFD